MHCVYAMMGMLIMLVKWCFHVFMSVLCQVDITDQLPEIGHQATLIGKPGLRQMMYRTQRSSHAVRFTAADDRKRLACKATVSDIGSALVIATLLIHRQLPLFSTCYFAVNGVD